MAAAGDDDAAAAGPRQPTRFIVVPLYGDGQEPTYDVPVNASVTIGRNDAHALDNQHISRRHLCISVNYDLHGRALLLAHNTGKNTFRIVSFARRKHARVQQAKFCRLYSGDVVEMLYDTQARYAVQVLEVSVTGMPLLHHTPVVPSLYAFKTRTGRVPDSSSQAAKQALELGMKHEEGGPDGEGEDMDGAGDGDSPTPSPPPTASSVPLVAGGRFLLGLATSGSAAAAAATAAAAAGGESQLTQASLSHVATADAGPPRLIRVASDVPAASLRAGTDDDGDATGQHGVEDAAFETGAHEDDTGTPGRAGTPALSREGSAQSVDGHARSSSSQGGAAFATAAAAAIAAVAPRKLSGLPTRILRRAMAFLSLPDLLSCACVSRSWESTVTTSGVLSTVRIGAFCPGVHEPPFRLLLNVATRSRWCLNHLSLARCRWATAGHLAMFLGLPIRLRPHAYSVATGDPSLGKDDSRRVVFAPDGPANDPCALSPAETALEPESLELGRQASAPEAAPGAAASAAAAAAAGASSATSSLAAAAVSSRSYSLGPSASASAAAGRAAVTGKHAAMPFNLSTPESAVDFLAADGQGTTSTPVTIEASTSQRWLLKTAPKPRRLLDAFLNLFVNRTLRAMSRAEALAIRDAAAYADTPAYGVLSSIRRDMTSLRGPIDERLSAALTSRNVAVAYENGQKELEETGREHARVAPRDPLTEDLADGAILRRGHCSKSAPVVSIPGVGPVWVEQPMINKESFRARITAAPSLRARAAIAAWAEIKLESLRPGFPSGDTKSPVALFKVAAATTRGIPVRRIRAITALGQADDEASQNALDVANDNEDHDPELRAQEMPGRSGFFDMRLSRLPLGSVDVATEKRLTLPGNATGHSGSGGDDATEPQSPSAASAPDTDSDVDSVRGAAVAGSIDDRDTLGTTAAGPASAEDDADSDEEEDLTKVAKITKLRPATMSLGAAPGSAFAMLDSRGKAVDPYFLFAAVNMTLPALQEHIAARSKWVSPWQAPLAAAEAAVTQEMAHPTSSSSATERAAEAASRAVRGYPKTIDMLQKSLMDDISPADVVTWIPAPAFGATPQPRPRAITERHGPVVNGSQTWLPPTNLQRMSDPIPPSFASPVRSLDLHGCANINPMALTIILRYCPELTALRLGGMLQLALPNLMALPACVPNLRYIDLEGIHQLSDGAVHAFAQHCPGLQRANFDGCIRLTDEAFVGSPNGLCVKCPDLRHLSLRGCENITGSGFAAIARACPKLVSLNLAGNQEVSIRDLTRALVACPDLESLKVEIWHKQDKDHARFRILENVRRAARYCFKSLHSSDRDYQALAACERFAESLKAAEESRKTDGTDLDGSEAADDDS